MFFSDSQRAQALHRFLDAPDDWRSFLVEKGFSRALQENTSHNAIYELWTNSSKGVLVSLSYSSNKPPVWGKIDFEIVLNTPALNAEFCFKEVYCEISPISLGSFTYGWRVSSSLFYLESLLKQVEESTLVCFSQEWACEDQEFTIPTLLDFDNVLIKGVTREEIPTIYNGSVRTGTDAVTCLVEVEKDASSLGISLELAKVGRRFSSLPLEVRKLLRKQTYITKCLEQYRKARYAGIGVATEQPLPIFQVGSACVIWQS